MYSDQSKHTCVKATLLSCNTFIRTNCPQDAKYFGLCRTLVLHVYAWSEWSSTDDDSARQVVSWDTVLWLTWRATTQAMPVVRAYANLSPQRLHSPISFVSRIYWEMLAGWLTALQPHLLPKSCFYLPRALSSLCGLHRFHPVLLCCRWMTHLGRQLLTISDHTPRCYWVTRMHWQGWQGCKDHPQIHILEAMLNFIAEQRR
jgi:hypothetical protein